MERPSRDIHRLVGGVLMGGATVLCAGTASLGYVTTYAHERAVSQATAQIAEQGPRIVEQMLSYSAESIQQDFFARAQALTTDGYRPQLIAQQRAAQDAGAAATNTGLSRAPCFRSHP